MAIRIPDATDVELISFPGLPGLENLPHVHQMVNNWCWAAGIEMASSVRGLRLDKCEVANRRFEQHELGIAMRSLSCCYAPDMTDPDGCNRDITPVEISALLTQIGIPFVTLHRRLDAREILWHVRKGHPILAAWIRADTPDRRGHMVVMTGFDAATGELRMNNPYDDFEPRFKVYIKDEWPYGHVPAENFEIYHWIIPARARGWFWPFASLIPDSFFRLRHWFRSLKGMPHSSQNMEPESSTDFLNILAGDDVQKKTVDTIKNNLGRLMPAGHMQIQEILPYTEMVVPSQTDGEENGETPLRLVLLSENNKPRCCCVIRISASDPFQIMDVFPQDVAERLDQSLSWVDDQSNDATEGQIVYVPDYSVMILKFKLESSADKSAVIAYAPPFIELPDPNPNTSEADIFSVLSQLAAPGGIVADPVP